MFPFSTCSLYKVKQWIKTSLAPGSRVVTEYLLQRFAICLCFCHKLHIYLYISTCHAHSNFLFSGLQKYLNQLGFHTAGYGCTTCIGNSGELDDSVASAILENGT